VLTRRRWRVVQGCPDREQRAAHCGARPHIRPCYHGLPGFSCLSFARPRAFLTPVESQLKPMEAHSRLLALTSCARRCRAGRVPSTSCTTAPPSRWTSPLCQRSGWPREVSAVGEGECAGGGGGFTRVRVLGAKEGVSEMIGGGRRLLPSRAPRSFSHPCAATYPLLRCRRQGVRSGHHPLRRWRARTEGTPLPRGKRFRQRHQRRRTGGRRVLGRVWGQVSRSEPDGQDRQPR
jgi:hypothetical protein